MAGALVAGNFGDEPEFLHDGRQSDRAAISRNVPVPNWLFNVNSCGIVGVFPLIDQQTRRALTFVMGVVPEGPPASIVCRAGLHCVWTPERPTVNPRAAKPFCNDTVRGVARNDARNALVVVVAAA